VYRFVIILFFLFSIQCTHYENNSNICLFFFLFIGNYPVNYFGNNGSLLTPSILNGTIPQNGGYMPSPSSIFWPLGLRSKPRRGMLRRAVFSDQQRKGLEVAFLKQKYISKPERKKLAQRLGLKDSQVNLQKKKKNKN
jgi:hypothetical protein